MDVNRRELAEIFSVTKPTIDAYIKRGMPVKDRGAKGKQAVFSTGNCIDWLISEKVKRATGGAEGESKDGLEKRKLAAQVRVAEIDAEIKSGSVFDAADVAMVLSSVLATVRANVMNLPNRFPEIKADLEHDCEGILISATKQIQQFDLDREEIGETSEASA